MTKRPYEPALKQQISDVLEMAEQHEEQQRKKRAAIEKVKRDLFTFKETGVLPRTCDPK